MPQSSRLAFRTFQTSKEDAANMKATVDFGQAYGTQNIANALQQAARELNGEYYPCPVHERVFIVLGSANEEKRSDFIYSQTSFPFNAVATRFFKSTALTVDFTGAQAYSDRDLGLATNAKHSTADVNIKIRGKATMPGTILSLTFLCIPFIGWVALYKFFNRSVATVPKACRDQTQKMYLEYFSRVGAILKQGQQSA